MRVVADVTVVPDGVWSLDDVIAKIDELAPAPKARAIQETGRVNIFWLIALAQAVFIGFILFTGRVRIRGRLLADRDTEPRRFWFYVIGFSASLPIIVMQAIWPPY